jgi:hypothetical protein
MYENLLMTPYDRLDTALARKRIAWTKLAEKLEIKKANLSNWKKTGIPFKHLRACADFAGVSKDWLELGEGDMYPAQDAQPAQSFSLKQLPSNPRVAHAHYEKHAINPDSLHCALQIFGDALDDIDPARISAIGSLLANLIHAPNDRHVYISAIETLLTPLHDDDLQKKSA